MSSNKIDSRITMFRGYQIRIDPSTGKFIFCDTGNPTIENWKNRPCGHCGRHNTQEGHDGCLGTLAGVINACCGHGEPENAYVQFENGSDIRGKKALSWAHACKTEEEKV